jgi:hypothetical protein
MFCRWCGSFFKEATELTDHEAIHRSLDSLGGHFNVCLLLFYFHVHLKNNLIQRLKNNKKNDKTCRKYNKLCF